MDKQENTQETAQEKKKLPAAFFVKRSILGIVIALLVCGCIYAGITVYVRNTEEPDISVDQKKDDTTEQEEERDPIDSVVTDTDEVTYDRYEIDKTVTNITIGQAGDETIASVTDPNTANSQNLVLLTKGVRFARIVYPEGDNAAKAAAQNLNRKLADQTGYQLQVVSDSTAESACEILVGATNRSASGQAQDKMRQQSAAYAVQCTGEKVALAGSNTTALNKAADYLLTRMTAGKGEAQIAKNLSYTWNSSNTYHKAIYQNASLSVKTKRQYDIKQVTGVPQGGCSDGTYFYQLLITKQDKSDENNNECKIVKVDLKTGTHSKTSGVLPLNHANDVTYNSKLNCLVVCHNAPNRTTLSYVDVNTLKITKTFQIDYEIYCIDYNASTDRYVVGLSGGQTFRILDGSFKAVGKVHMPVDETKDHVTQGVGSDDEFIYFALYKSGIKCVITVFDWDGNYVSTLHLDDTAKDSVQGREIETVSVVNGEIYLSCAATTWESSEIYKITGLQAK